LLPILRRLTEIERQPSLDRNAASATAEPSSPDGSVNGVRHNRSRWQVNRFFGPVDYFKPMKILAGYGFWSNFLPLYELRPGAAAAALHRLSDVSSGR
jgi:hypothetical protein